MPEVLAHIQEAAESQRRSGVNFPLRKCVHHVLRSRAMLLTIIGAQPIRVGLSRLRRALGGILGAPVPPSSAGS